MKVLHVSSARTWRGGEQQVVLLMEGLARRGVAQRLLAPRGSALAARARGAGLPAEEIPIRNEGDVRALGRIVGRLRAARPDVLHLHTSQAHGLGAVAARLAGRRRPRIVVSRRVEHSIFRHAFLGLDRLKYHPGVDRVLCVSQRVRLVLEADGIPESMLAVVHDGVDLERFAAPGEPRGHIRARLGIPDDARLIGTVGHLDESKGHDVLLAAFAALPEPVAGAPPWLVLVGDGPRRRALEAEARQRGVAERVRFAGHSDDVPDLLRAMDAFAFPSLHEGLGSALLEAMAARVPVVATNVGGIGEVVRDGEHGRLVPPADAEVLASAIRRTLDDPEESRRRAQAAYERIRKMFTADRMVDATLRAYAERA